MRCKQIGHAPGDKLHDGDRWIANRTLANNLNDQSGDIIAATDSLNNLVGKFAAQQPVLDRAIKTLPEAVTVLNTVEAFRTRPLDAGPYTFVAADALVHKVRAGGRAVNVHALIAAGVNTEGYREILGLDVTTAGDGAGWLTFWRSLTARNLSGSSSSPVTPCRRGGRDRCLPARRGLAVVQNAQPDGGDPESWWPWVRALLHSVFDQPDRESVAAQRPTYFLVQRWQASPTAADLGWQVSPLGDRPPPGQGLY